MSTGRHKMTPTAVMAWAVPKQGSPGMPYQSEPWQDRVRRSTPTTGIKPQERVEAPTKRYTRASIGDARDLLRATWMTISARLTVSVAFQLRKHIFVTQAQHWKA
jgi:hypothetical protein